MVTAVFGSGSGGESRDWSLTLNSPATVLAAHTYNDVIQLVKEAEHAALRGSYVAMMLTYEAASAFDHALITHSPSSSLPLAWAAIFESSADTTPTPTESYQTTAWKPAITQTEYRNAVEKILQLIAEGFTYQVNFSFPMTATFEGDPFSYYIDLTRAQGARYSAFLDLGDFQILSLSPELFFERKGKQVRTRPMKGTIRRGRWTTEDRQLGQSLQDSKKDQAENVMIVDLIRNDLGRVSKTGSVNVTALFELERFETLWQMTSTVESTLKDDVGLLELLTAMFPCGSITGAPKISTMKIINGLEPHPRGIYTGTIGLLRPGGDCSFNVAIRTIQLRSQSGAMTFGVGGGVTIDSTVEREYSECLVKSAFLEARPVPFQLLETILLDGGIYFLLARHLKRMTDSAAFFGFPFDREKVSETLSRLASTHSANRWKVRMLLSKDGSVHAEISETEPRSDVRRVVLASEPVQSTNRMLFHKTTDRSAYRSALDASHNYDDVIFFNERGEVTEASNANIVLQVGDELCTPPISSGLLAGTFREELLSEGKIKERVISVEELFEPAEFFLINSVQKWMTARIDRRTKIPVL